MEVGFKLNSFIAIILLFCLCRMIRAQNFKREKQGVSFAKFVKASSVKLNVFKLARLKVSKLGECTFECVNNQDCYSVNFGAYGDGKHACELLRNDKFSRASRLEASAEFDHYFIKTPCMSAPCANGGSCWPKYSEDDYKCKCEKGFGGKHCEKESPCRSSPCLNNATCETHYSNNSYSCRCAVGFGGKQCEVNNWIQMTPSSVCFGAAGDSFGTFAAPINGSVITFKLIYQSGNIQCAIGSKSHWGCYNFLIPEGHNMGTHITDSQKNHLLPKDEFMAEASSSSCFYKFYYSLPGLTANSPELLFDNFTTPRYISAGEQFQIWFAEDLADCFQFDNSGATCVEVYGLFV